MPRPRRPMLPLAPLMAATVGHGTHSIRAKTGISPETERTTRTYDRPAPIALLAELVAVNRKSVYRWAATASPSSGRRISATCSVSTRSAATSRRVCGGR